MRISRDLIVVSLLFAALCGFTIYGVQRRAELDGQQETITPYSTRAAAPDGTLALQTWLSALGYEGRRLESEPFDVPAAARALFVFPRREAYTDAETSAVMRWVEEGNTLIVATAGLAPAEDPLSRELQFKLVPVGYVNRVALAQPLNGLAPIGDVLVRTGLGLEPAHADYVQYLTAVDKPLLVSWTRGKGTVFLTSAPFLFTNDGLHDDANAMLTLALISRVPRGGVIALDEFHLASGRPRTGCAASLLSVLICQPWGWAIIYVFVVVGVYVMINGRRFGRVMPLPREVARRNPAEYVISMSQLFRRAGKRTMIAQHYRRQLKRNLGRPYRINAEVPNEEFVMELSRYRDVDRAPLLELLNALDQPVTSERSLLRLAADAIRLRRQAEHNN
jgi:hypothetical protein